MGGYFPDEEKVIPELRALSQEAKGLICHHLCNSLSVVLGGIEIGNYEMAQEAVGHMLEDLERMGIRQPEEDRRTSVEAFFEVQKIMEVNEQ